MTAHNDDSDTPDRWPGKTKTETAELKRLDANRATGKHCSPASRYRFAALVVALALLLICWLQLR